MSDDIPGAFKILPVVMTMAILGWLGLQLHNLPLSAVGLLAFVPAFYYIVQAAAVRNKE